MAKKKKNRVDAKKLATPTPTNNLQKALDHAAESGRYMVAVFTLNGADVQMYRQTQDFPTDDFETCVDLLEQDLNRERASMEPPATPKDTDAE